jgi:hypothetical protein
MDISTPGAVITGATVRAPDVRIGAAVGGGSGRYHSGHTYRYGHHRSAYRSWPTGGRSLLSPELEVNERCDWISVPIYGRTGGVTHTAYYWNPTVMPPLTEIARRVDPALFGEPEDDTEIEPTLRVEDEALEAMRGGRYGEAARLYQMRWMAIVDSELGIDEGTPGAIERDFVLGALGQNHAEVLRLRAVALVGARRHAHAAQELMRAYEMDPALAGRALFGKELIGDAYRLRRLVNSSVRYAHKSGDEDAWVLVAMLMQAEGREQVARRMLRRAQALRRALPDAAPRVEEEDRERPLSIFRE